MAKDDAGQIAGLDMLAQGLDRDPERLGRLNQGEQADGVHVGNSPVATRANS